MKDYKQIIAIIVTVGIVLIASLAAISFFARDASPVEMMLVFGGIMALVLAIALGRDIAARLALTRDGKVDASMSVMQRNEKSATRSGKKSIRPSPRP
jgi:flagellar motor component MotA